MSETPGVDGGLHDASARFRALDIFDEYVELSARERECALDRLKQREPCVHAQLISLLAAHHAPSIIDDDAISAVSRATKHGHHDADSRVGSRLGAWRIDRLVAEGGMGTVYEAHRADGQYARRVALKCIRGALTSPFLIRWFYAERCHLASLEHPGIAEIVDGGVDEFEHPWYAMRYVDGLPIGAWCEERGAGLRDRARLTMQVCDALAHAHERGIAHRDIKLSNVLVTHDGQAQLIDFGISLRSIDPKATAREHEPDTAEAWPMEANAGDGVSVDICAVGVLMQHLMIPVALQHPGVSMSISTRGAQNRPAPSARPSEATMVRDLNLISRKCMEIDDGDRYGDVLSVRNDIQRCLDHRPLGFHTSGLLHKLSKFARRNGSAIALASVLIVILATFTAASEWHRRRISSELRASAATSRLFSSTLGLATLSGLGSERFSSKELLARTEQELDRLNLSEHPKLHARSLATLARGHATIGDYAEAERLANEAQYALGTHDDTDGTVLTTRLSILNARAQHAKAKQLAERLLERFEDQNDEQTARIRIILRSELAKAQWGLGAGIDAMATIGNALREAEAMPAGEEELAAQLLIQRSALHQAIGEHEAAKADAARAALLTESRSPLLADDATERLLSIRLDIESELSDVLPQSQRLMSNRLRVFGAKHPKTAQAMLLVAAARVRGGGADMVRNEIAAALSIIEATYGRKHPDYVEAYIEANRILGERDDQLRYFRWALRTLEEALPATHHTTTDARRKLGMRLVNMPTDLRRPEHRLEGEALLRTNLHMLPPGLLSLTNESLLAGSLIMHGPNSELQEAERLLVQARRTAHTHYRPAHNVRAFVDRLWPQLRYRQGHRTEADHLFEQLASASAGQIHDHTAGDIHVGLVGRALHAYETCRHSDAETFLRRAVENDRAYYGPDDWITLTSQGYLDSLRAGEMRNVTGELDVSAAMIESAIARGNICADRAKPKGSRGPSPHKPH